LSRIQGNFTQLTTDQSNAEQSGATSTDTQLTNLQGAANGAVTILAGEVNSSALHAAGDLGASMSAFARTVSDLVANTVANSSLAKNHAAAVDALKSAVDVLVTLAKNLDDVVQQHATDAKALDVLFTKLLADSAAFPVPEQTAPEWITLATDLAAAKVKADLVSKVAADIAQRAAQLRSAVEDLHDKLVTTVDADAHSLSAKADQIRTDVTGDLETEQGKVQASIGNISNGLATFNAQVVDAQSSIAGARTEAQTSLSNERSKASASLANAKDAVQAGVNEAVGSVQTALDKANSDYAQWVALVQIAHAHQLPGGNATGANVQNGAYVYRISGTA
jgi:hypothetical protein